MTNLEDAEAHVLPVIKVNEVVLEVDQLLAVLQAALDEEYGEFGYKITPDPDNFRCFLFHANGYPDRDTDEVVKFLAGVKHGFEAAAKLGVNPPS